MPIYLDELIARVKVIASGQQEVIKLADLTKQSMSQIEASQAKSALAAGKQAHALDQVDRSARKMTSALSGARSEMSAMAPKFAILNQLFEQGIRLIGRTIQQLGGVRGILSAGFDVESWQAGFEVILGGTDRAAEHMRELIQFSKETPFNLSEIVQASQLMEALDLSTQKYLRTLGDAASLLQRDLPEAIMALASVRQGEFRSIKRFLPNIEDIMARSGIVEGAGHTQAQLMRLVDDVTKELDARFGGGMARMEKTAKAKLSDIADEFLLFKVQIAQSGIGEAVTNMLQRILDKVAELERSGKLSEWAKGASSALEGILDAGEGVIGFTIRYKEQLALLTGAAGLIALTELTIKAAAAFRGLALAKAAAANPVLAAGILAGVTVIPPAWKYIKGILDELKTNRAALEGLENWRGGPNLTLPEVVVTPGAAPTKTGWEADALARRLAAAEAAKKAAREAAQQAREDAREQEDLEQTREREAERRSQDRGARIVRDAQFERDIYGQTAEFYAQSLRHRMAEEMEAGADRAAFLRATGASEREIDEARLDTGRVLIELERELSDAARETAEVRAREQIGRERRTTDIQRAIPGFTREEAAEAAETYGFLGELEAERQSAVQNGQIALEAAWADHLTRVVGLNVEAYEEMTGAGQVAFQILGALGRGFAQAQVRFVSVSYDQMRKAAADWFRHHRTVHGLGAEIVKRAAQAAAAAELEAIELVLKSLAKQYAIKAGAAFAAGQIGTGAKYLGLAALAGGAAAFAGGAAANLTRDRGEDEKREETALLPEEADLDRGEGRVKITAADRTINMNFYNSINYNGGLNLFGPEAARALVEETIPYIQEAIDNKQLRFD